MEKEYMDAKQITSSVVGLYLELAKLKKQGKEESEKYVNFLSLLLKALEVEKRKYLILTPNEIYIESCKDVLKNTSKIENVLLSPDKEIIVALRMLNFLDKKMYYSLFDSTPKDNDVHYYLEEAFLGELVKHIYKVDCLEKERIIDYVYAILASSSTFCFEDLAFLKSNFPLKKQDYMAIQYDLLPKIEVLNDNLFSFTDAELTKDTIALVLFLKASLSFHSYKRNVLDENNNNLQLKEILAAISSQECHKICELLSLLNEEELKKDRSF